MGACRTGWHNPSICWGGWQAVKDRPKAGHQELVHILPGQGAFDGELQVKAVTWLVIAIPKKTSFTSEEVATSALQELRFSEVEGKGEVNVEEKDVPKNSRAHMEEQSEQNMVVENAPMVDDTPCMKRGTTDEVVEECAEEAPSVKVGEGTKVESVEEAKTDEEPKEGVGKQCKSWDNTTSGDNTPCGDNTTSGEKTTGREGDAKPVPSGDVASSSSATLLVPTEGTPYLWDPK